MRQETVQKIFEMLNRREVRYLLAGGLAVAAHGYLRFTADVDLVLDLEQDNLKAAVRVFTSLGYRPRAPVALEDFADPEKRRKWIIEKGMTVFSLWSPEHPATEIDIFAEEPLPFQEAYERRVCLTVAEGIVACVISLDDLLDLKRRAGRAMDLADIEKLIAVREDIDDE